MTQTDSLQIVLRNMLNGSLSMYARTFHSLDEHTRETILLQMISTKCSHFLPSC